MKEVEAEERGRRSKKPVVVNSTVRNQVIKHHEKVRPSHRKNLCSTDIKDRGGTRSSIQWFNSSE